MDGEKNLAAVRSCLSGEFERPVNDRCEGRAAIAESVTTYPRVYERSKRTVRSRSLHHRRWIAALMIS